MTILWEFDEKHPKQVSAFEGSSSILKKPPLSALPIKWKK
jgi:hypothetical protein